MTISATITPGVGGLVPGGNPAAVSLTVNNPGSGKQYVNQVTLASLAAYTDSTESAPATGCNTTLSGATPWFSMAAVNVGQEVGPSSSVSATGSLVFNDLNTSQDACKGAYLVATFNSN